MKEEGTIMEIIGKRQMKWFGYLCRMIPKTVYEWKLKGRKHRRHISDCEGS